MERSHQLVVHRFGPDASFEGGLVGALERAEADGSLRVVEVLFVHRDADSGEIVALDERASGGGFAIHVLGFRLEERERRAATERAMVDDASGTAAVLAELAETLAVGEAVAAVLFAHGSAEALPDPVGETAGSRQIVNEIVEAQTLADVPEMLRQAGT